jgi:hypothetical protein
MADAAAPAPFAQPTSVHDAEVMFTSFGLTPDIIRLAIANVDREDAHIQAGAYDPTHRGVNRWGHALANLRIELARYGWDWEREHPTLRSMLAPGGCVQVCVAAARWIEGKPLTLPRGWHTIQAVETNRQLWIPVIGQPRGTPVAGTITWILCFQQVVTPSAEPGGPATVEYKYELSEPKTITGTGNRKRVVDWRLRCFEGSISIERPIESLRDDEHYDHEQTEDLDDLIGRK